MSVGGMVGVVSGGGRGWLPMWAGAGEEAAASTIIYVCLHISAAKRPPVADEVPLCAVPYVQYAWAPAGTAKSPSQQRYTKFNSGPNKDVPGTSLMAHIPTCQEGHLVVDE